MTLPNLTGLTPADIAEFDQLIDQMPHGYAKHLHAWLNEKILAQHERDKRNAAELEAMCQRIEAERAATQEQSFADFLAESCVPASPKSETLH